MKWKLVYPPPTARFSIVQPAEFNHFLESYVQLSWLSFLKKFALWTLLTALVYFPAMESLTFVAWVEDKPVDPMLFRIALGALFTGMILATSQECALWFQNRGVRKIEICTDGIHFGEGNLLSWNGITNWSLVPVEADTKLRKMSLQFDALQVRNPNALRIPILLRKKRDTRRLAIILQHPDQTQTLLHELASLRESGMAIPALVEQSGPSMGAIQKGKGNSTVLLCFFSSLWLLFHGGAIFLLFGWATTGTTLGNTTQHQMLLNRWLSSIFSSRDQMIAAMLIAGGTMIVGGIALYIYGLLLGGKSRNQLTTSKSE